MHPDWDQILAGQVKLKLNSEVFIRRAFEDDHRVEQPLDEK